MTSPTLMELGHRARSAARQLARSSTRQREEGMRVAADLLESQTSSLLEANRHDVEAARKDGMAGASLDRLSLSESRIASMAEGLRAIAELPDPVGEVVDTWRRPNGLLVERVRVPLGVIGVIYENRPNVTSDVAGLCVKAANTTMLRGSSSALRSNQAIVGVLQEAFAKVDLPSDSVLLVKDTRHETAVAFMRLRGLIDCLVPRGGPALIASLLEHATVPYVLDGDGNCHVYVDASADPEVAKRIVVNAKTSRPGVCNAAESLLVHAAIAPGFLPTVTEALVGVELLGDERTRAIIPSASIASDEDFATEFLDLKMTVAVVDDVDDAISHIARYGSGHSEAIVTGDEEIAEQFVREVDAAAVLVNASTRFIDGSELGLGAEVGISTQKLHARGPMGIAELTCLKWVVRGDGHIRT